MISGVKQLVDAELDGKERRYSWRKTPSVTTNAGFWFDLSMSPGRPVPKYWFDSAPLTARVASYSADGGLEHGGGVSPSEKYLRLTTAIATAATALPLTMILCDYLLYYPTIDESSLEEHVMDNTTTLSRYEDGEGVQIVGVIVSASSGLACDFVIDYTNSRGEDKTTTATLTPSPGTPGQLTSTGQSYTTQQGPFIKLADGDTGARKINKVTMLSADTGLFSLILVKPLGTSVIREITAPAEKDYFMESSVIPRIYDDAYLSFLCLPQGTLASTVLMGDIKTIWT